jgi:hypothetical protein
LGGQAIVAPFVPDLLPVPMPVTLGTTEFNFSLPKLMQEYNGAYAAAALTLGRQIRVKPAEVKGILKSFYAQMIEVINSPQRIVDDVRVSLIQPFGDTSFRVVGSFNMDSDADDRLIFSNLTKGAADAFRDRAPAFLNFNAIWSAGRAPHMTKYELALLRKSLQSAICFPIFRDQTAWEKGPIRPSPLGVVSIDSDADLTHIFSNTSLLEKLAKLTLQLSAVFER